jgi:sodium transport system permease protein
MKSMNWSNVRLILGREVRDQLRDRRTLFMIAVLPLLLYPLLGMSLFQVAQFVRDQPTKVLIMGAQGLPKSPPLIVDNHFAMQWFNEPDKAGLLELHEEPREAKQDPADQGASPQARAQHAVEKGEYEAAVYFPADFASRLETFRASLQQKPSATAGGGKGTVAESEVPSPEIYYDTAKEKSQLAYLRVTRVLSRWTEEIGRQNLASTHLPESAVKPFAVAEHDLADEHQRDAAIWSKILPFLLLIWALTGAFYPAVDLCAGEKERGTLETLLSSPAERSEIVWGKLLTIMLFSVATAVLNILSMGLTGSIVISQLPAFGPPPPLAPLWLLMALLPVSALFSALCLALASLARSSKEGQYYLMPLVLVTMPLVVLPMSPGVELNLGNSMIPLTGVVLLLRSMLQGNYLEALPFVIPVAGVTLGCCLLAIRWAIDQFNSESVLFRESERLDFGLWIKHLLRDREDTPSVAAAVVCGVLILLVRFFMSFALPQPSDFAGLAELAVVTQLVVIGTPALLMTIMLTRNPPKTLLLRLPPLGSVPAAVLLAVLLHPAVNVLNVAVQKLYPVNAQMQKVMASLLGENPNIWVMLLALALAPAIFEEFAFRGFILSGFRHLGHKWRAIALSSFFFAITHAVFQQSIVAFLVGLLIGYLAVQTSSLLPGIAYHLVHNSLALIGTQITPQVLRDYPVLGWIVRQPGEQAIAFYWPVILIGAALAMLVLAWFRSLPYAPTAEESLQETIERRATHVVAG